MKKLFKRFLGVCVICLPVACSGNLTDAQYVQRAQDYLARGELQAASIELKNALQRNRENAQARILLGQVQLDVGNAAEAEKELRRASELGVDDGAVLPLLARALLAQGKQDELQALSLENLTGKDRKAEVLAAQGLGKLAQADMEGAAAPIDEAVSLDPQSAYAAVAQARLLAARQEPARARQVLDHILEREADYAPAWSLLGDLETLDGQWAKAEVAYNKAVENRADNFADLLKRAKIHIQLKQYDAAQKDIDVLKKRAPQHPGVNFAQGMIYFSNDRFPQAREAFELTVRANKHHMQAMYYLSQSHLRLGNHQQAQDYAQQFFSAAPRSIHARKLMASIELENRQYAKAEELMRPVVASREDDVEAINLLAKALLKQDKTQKAIELLEKAVSLQPDSALAQFRLGSGLLAAGQYERGVEHLEKALEMDPQLQQADVLLVHYHLEQRDFDQALASADAYRNRHPDSAAPYNLIGRVQLVAERETEAAEAFSRARELAPGDPTANHSLAVLAVRKKAYEEARGYYQDVLEHHDNHLSTLLKLAVLDGVENEERAMLERLQQAAKAHPKSVQPKVLLARYYLTQGQSAKVPTLMFELSERQRQTPAVLEVMALSQLAQEQYPEAKYDLEQLTEQQPDSTLAHFLLARANAGLGDRAGLKSELERTVELEPKNFAARLSLARLLLLEGEKEKVTEQLAVLDELSSPEHPEVLRLRASQARAQGDQATTSALLEDVFEASPTTASMLSVAQQKWAMGDQAGALELQEQWVEERPEDLSATLALAGTYSQQDQVEAAIAKYKRVLEKDADNVAALNGLAWHLRNQQPAKALKYAERAAELAPKSTLVMDTLAVVQLKNGQVQRAKRNIERVYQKKPNAPTVRYHRAMIDAAAGDRSAAIEALQALLGEGREFAEKAEAEQLLAELQSGG